MNFISHVLTENTDSPSVRMFTLDVITVKENSTDADKNEPGASADTDILQLKIGSLPNSDVDPYNKTVSKRGKQGEANTPTCTETGVGILSAGQLSGTGSF